MWAEQCLSKTNQMFVFEKKKQKKTKKTDVSLIPLFLPIPLSKSRIELCKLSDHALYLYQVPQNISKGFRVTQFPYFNFQRG